MNTPSQNLVKSHGPGYVLFVNEEVSLPDDFTTPVVPDLLLTLSSGNVVQGSFSIGSMASVGVSSTNAISSISGMKASVSPLGGGSNQFGLTFNAITNASFSAWCTTNLLNGQWQWVGAVSQSSPGLFQLFDSVPTSAPYRFYRVSSP